MTSAALVTKGELSDTIKKAISAFSATLKKGADISGIIGTPKKSALSGVFGGHKKRTKSERNETLLRSFAE